MQLAYTGGWWGFYTTIKYYRNLDDPTKSDAVLFFSSVSPAIPAGKLPSHTGVHFHQNSCIVKSVVSF